MNHQHFLLIVLCLFLLSCTEFPKEDMSRFAISYDSTLSVFDSLRIHRTLEDSVVATIVASPDARSAGIKGDTTVIYYHVGYFAGYDFELKLLPDTVILTGLRWSDAVDPVWLIPDAYHIVLSKQSPQVGDTLIIKIEADLSPADSIDYRYGMQIDGAIRAILYE